MRQRWTDAASWPQLLLGLVATAIAIVVTGALVADAVRDAKRARDTITVTGSAKQPISADVVTWTLSVSTQDRSPAAASRKLRTSAGRVRVFIGRYAPSSVVQEPPVSTSSSSRHGQVAGGSRCTG